MSLLHFFNMQFKLLSHFMFPYCFCLIVERKHIEEQKSELPKFCLLQQETDFKKDTFECAWEIRTEFLLPEFASRVICTGENPDPTMFYSQHPKQMQMSMKDLDEEIKEKMMYKLSY